MESKRLVKINFNDNLFTTAKYEDVVWDNTTVQIATPHGMNVYPWHTIASLEIFETE